MDKAFWGTMRWGHFRWGVYDPKFDVILEQRKSQSARSMGGKTPSIVGTACVGRTRVGVSIPLFDEVLQSMKKRG